MLRVFVLFVVLVSCSGCRYFCKNHLQEDYCCDDGSDYGPPTRHDGGCPIVRDVCTGVQERFGRPGLCPHDGACPLHAKCCYDICLRYHTCKPAQRSIVTIATPVDGSPVTLPTLKKPGRG